MNASGDGTFQEFLDVHRGLVIFILVEGSWDCPIWCLVALLCHRRFCRLIFLMKVLDDLVKSGQKILTCLAAGDPNGRAASGWALDAELQPKLSILWATQGEYFIGPSLHEVLSRADSLGPPPLTNLQP